MVLAAAAALGVAPQHCAVVGDIGADVGAARAAGARAVLVPTPVTRARGGRRRPAATASRSSPTCSAAVDLLLAPAGPDAPGPRVTTTLVVRLDSDGDVLLAGPAVRAVAACR